VVAARTVADRRAAAQARRARRAEVTDADVVMDAAAAFLAVRPRSVAEVRRRLRRLGYPPGLVDEVVDRLVDLRYLDDAAFARAWVESRDRARPRGILALRQELQRKGVSREVTEAVLAERASGAMGRPDGAESPGDVDGRGKAEAELTAALHLLGRRERVLSRELDERRRRQKAYALLARHGFTPDVCRQAVMTISDAGPEIIESEVS
jgi:regulatory protein